LNKALTDSPEDRGVQGLIVKYEKAKTIERTRRGRLYKAKMDKIVSHLAPYGYRYVKGANGEGQYVVERSEADIVRLIFNLYIKHKSVRAVVKELTKGELNLRRVNFGVEA